MQEAVKVSIDFAEKKKIVDLAKADTNCDNCQITGIDQWIQYSQSWKYRIGKVQIPVAVFKWVTCHPFLIWSTLHCT